jgi:hypothetical protein
MLSFLSSGLNALFTSTGHRSRCVRERPAPKLRARPPCVESLEERCLPSTYSMAIAGDQPAAYYRLGESSGTTAIDSSGNGNHGTYLGGVTLGQPGALAGDSDTSVAFNGVDGIVDTNFQPNDLSFSVEAWVKPPSAIDHEWTIAGRSGWGELAYNAWDGISEPVHATPGYAGIAIFDGTRFDVTLSTTVLPLNQWTYLAGTWNNSTKGLDLYVNGVLDHHQTIPGTVSVIANPGATIQLGAIDETLHAAGSYRDGYFQGGVDEVAYYSYALTSVQVQQHYRAGIGAPSVEGVQVNDGSIQRSMVNSLTVTFSTIVTMDPGAFEVRHQNGNLVTDSFTSSVVGDHTVAAITFAGAEIIGGSLADGNYTLTVLADHVHAYGHGLDADNVTSFYRLFGDTQGHRTVDAADVAVLFSTFGKHAGDPGFISYLDYNGDGVIDDIDLYAFIARYGTTLNP